MLVVVIFVQNKSHTMKTVDEFTREINTITHENSIKTVPIMTKCLNFDKFLWDIFCHIAHPYLKPMHGIKWL